MRRLSSTARAAKKEGRKEVEEGMTAGIPGPAAGGAAVPSVFVRADAVSPYGVDPVRAPDLAAFWRVLVRRRWLITLTVLAVMGASTAAISALAPRYRAEALLLVGERQPTLLDIQKAVRGEDTEATDSEIEILRSPRIAKLVVEKLGLTKDPLINPELRPKNWLARAAREGKEALTAGLESVMPWLHAGGDESRAARPPDSAEHEHSAEEVAVARTADALLERLTVTAKGRSRVVNVAYEASDPRLAAMVANAVADAYIAEQLNAKVQASAQANQWLSQRVADIRDQLVATDREVQNRKAEAGISDGRQVGLVQEQISQLSEQLIAAHEDTVRAEARLQQVREAGPSEGVSVLLDSPVIQRLREERVDVQVKIAQAREVYGERNPAVLQMRAELVDLDSALQGEIHKIANAVKGDVEAARDREAALSRNLDDLKAQAARIGATEVDILAQQRDADANRALFDRLLSRAKEAAVESGLQTADAEIVSRADVPDRPAFPNKPLFLAAAFFAALAAAGLLVFCVESLDQGFRDLDEAERELGVPALGFIPYLPRRGAPGPESYAVERPLSTYAEAIRSIHTSLILSDVDRAPKRILVTSSLPGEGKTSLSVALARLMAAAGKRVILIDCDLRRRNASQLLGAGEGPGLVDCLLGTIAAPDAVLSDPDSGADLLPAGSRASNPADLLGSEAMRRLLAALGTNYDLVIMDSAPVLAVSDTRSFCRLADKVIMIVRWQSTRKAAAAPALKLIAAAGGDVAGTLLTHADTKRLASYSPRGYYARQVRAYLSD
jgi:polysaccharide biosynthesis transport protein